MKNISWPTLIISLGCSMIINITFSNNNAYAWGSLYASAERMANALDKIVNILENNKK